MTRICLLSAALLAGTSGIAHAQAADEAETSDRVIVVTATGQSSATSTTKTSTPIIESPQSISVVSREEMDLRASPTISDALAYTAGVQAAPSGLDSRVDEVTVRGFAAGGFSSNNNFVDGIRLPTGGQWTRTSFDTFAIQQVEVLKGPSGTLYGQSAPGGMVNIVTKRPTEQFHAEMMLQAVGMTDLGKWNTQAAVDVGGPVTSTLSARVVGLARYGDTQVDDVRNSRYYISPSLTWRPDENTTWTLLGQYQRDEGGATFQYLPATGALRRSNGQYIKLGDNLGEPDWNTYDRNQYLAASFFEHKFGDAITVRNNTRYTHLDSLYKVVVLTGDTVTTCTAAIAGCIAGQTIQRRAVQGNGKSDGISTDTQVEAHFATGPVKHTMLAGFDYFHTKWEHYRYYAATLPLLDIFDPQPRGASTIAASLVPQTFVETVSTQAGVYLQDQISLDRLRVTVSGRQDWYKDDQYNPRTATGFVSKSNAFTWRAGAVYLFDNGLAPYFSYAESFQPQVSDPATNLTGAVFKPTTGQQFEAGLRYQHKGIYLTLGAYQITQQNITTSASTDELAAYPGHACDDASCLVQTGEVRIRGVEFEAKASLPWGMAVVGSVTRSDSEITETRTAGQLGKKLAAVPDWMASALVSQKLENGLSFGGGARYTGKSFGENTNAPNLAIPDYMLFDVFARLDLGKLSPTLDGASFSLNARNVANKRYVATCIALSACYYGEGRTLTARLQFRW
ncbi:TonB-dependent siderophore receptor [Novosphingobium resinovorum]|uniref:TonB-dependent siderophore receptor n=1 Tax=Novosphingobium resinovorum TaxID=158500 RepID=UPI002ED1C632|nr:TonB-dependent siderophore receptor [Novosphingobium resinovorum]